MSELAKSARAAMKAKAERLGAIGSTKNAGPGDDPSKHIDASGWREPEINNNAMTGMRPVSRRQFKNGGHVSGEHTSCRADRKGRKSGGGVNAKVNRDVREANAELGKPHIGGFAEGGATNFRKAMHGMMGVGENLHGRRNGVGKFHRSHKASGGSVEGADYTAGMRPKGDRIPRASGGKTKGKGKTQIIIGIHAGGAHNAPPQGGPVMPPKPPMAPPPAPPGMPPGGAPPMGAGGPPGMMPPGMGMPPMGRKAGGKVVGAKYGDASISKAEKVKTPKGMPGGGAGGLGRLAKASMARKEGFKAI